MTPPIELGLDTFGDITDGPDGKPLSAAQVMRDLVEEGVLADEAGVDFLGVGEHHRADFAVTSPEMVLAAIAARTKRIRLGSAVTVLSSDDPIRVYQRFATLDAVSNGRAEVILGRGSFIESFPLFGFDLNQYETLFNEKLDLYAKVIKQQPVTWQGTTRAPLKNQPIFPKTESGTLTTWIGVGGTPESVMRAAHYGFPMMLAIIGGEPKRFAPFADLYRRALNEQGKAAAADRRALARLCRRDRRAGARRAVCRLQAHARQDRRRARLAAIWQKRVRARDRDRLALCRLAGDGRPQDRRDHQGARRQPLRHEVLSRSAAARQDDALHRALRPQGRAAGAGYGRLGQSRRSPVH